MSALTEGTELRLQVDEQTIHECDVPALELPAREAPLHAQELGLTNDGLPG